MDDVTTTREMMSPDMDHEGTLVLSVFFLLQTQTWIKGLTSVDPRSCNADLDAALPGLYISDYDNLFCLFWTQN